MESSVDQVSKKSDSSTGLAIVPRLRGVMFLLFLLSILLLGFYGVPFFVRAFTRSLPDNESAMRYEDLKIVVITHRLDNARITIDYGLEWLIVETQAPVVFMRQWCGSSVRFYDCEHRLLKAEEGVAVLGLPFLSRETPVFRQRMTAEVPGDAMYFSVGIGLLHTKPIPISPGCK